MDHTNSKEPICPIKGFSSSNNGLGETEVLSQTQNDEKALFVAKDPSCVLPNLCSMTPKKYDDSQETQILDETPSQDLHNGHTLSDDKVAQRTISMSELEPVVDGTPDTLPFETVNDSCPTEESGTKDSVEKLTPNLEKQEKTELDFSPVKKSDADNSEIEKSHSDRGTHNQGETNNCPEKNKESLSLESVEREGNSMDLKQSESLAGKTQDFDLHLSEIFLSQDEKKESSVNNGSNLDKEEKDKVDGAIDKFEGADKESSTEQLNCPPNLSKNSAIQEADSCEVEGSKTDKISKESDIKNDESDLKKTDDISSESPNTETSDKTEGDSSVENSTNELKNDKVDSSDFKTDEDMEVDEEAPEVETEKVGKKGPGKRVSFNEAQIGKLESDESNDGFGACDCVPGCHRRMDYISKHLDSACSQLEEFIKSKRSDNKKLLSNFLDMLKEIHNVSDNKIIRGESKLSDNVFGLEEAAKGGRRGIKRKSSDMESPQKATPRKKVAEDKPEEEETVDFKDLKGLAVFAKWPNSGWYYPGIVEDLAAADWKDVSSVTVKFYDGLVRDMKNINILPAYLIPAGSVLCDLEDETEMCVVSCDGTNHNSVEFKLLTKSNPDNIVDLNFNMLAIKAVNMKTIKVQLEPTTDATPKNMHSVSLDNLVSGRRSSRGKSKKDEDFEEKPRVERRNATPKKGTTPRRARN